MAELGEGPVIAVDVKASVAPDEVSRPAPENGERPRPRRRYALGGDRPPPFGETLARVLLLGSSKTSEAARRHADLTIRPRNEGVGLLEFHQLDRAREAGREAARAALENAPARLFS
jgi:predicted acylesterase/phospholipase RssA